MTFSQAAKIVYASPAAQAAQTAEISNSMGESVILEAMTAWHGKFGSQMPGFGRGDRTRNLVQRGVLRDMGEARFKGFTLHAEDESALLDARRRGDARPSMDEQRHHIRVLARIWGISEEDAAIRAGEQPPPPPRSFANSVKPHLDGAA